MQKTKVFFLQLVCFFLIISPSGLFAQEGAAVTVNLKDVTVLEVLKSIEKDTGFAFFYNNADVDVSRIVSVSKKNVSISEVVAAILPGYSCRFDNKKVILVKDESPSQSQSTPRVKREPYQIKGIIQDNSGLPLTGASAIVISDGKSYGAIADIDGRFILEFPEMPEGDITFSFMGFRDLVMPIGTKAWFDVVLQEDTELLDEVVVVGYGTMRRSLVTSAISKVKVDDSMMRSVESPASLLNGRVAGVSSMTMSGNVGSGERMTIRGASSISAGNEPLYVIDGIPITNTNANLTDKGEDMSALAVLSLSDIESIEVLKDAASAAIYGSKATNGVILITTKSGKEGTSNFRVNFSTGISQFADHGRLQMADSDLYVQVFNEGIDNYNKQYGYSMGDKGYKEHIANPFGTLEDIDWIKTVTRLAVQYNADVAFSGGTQKTRYYIGANYNHKEGVIRDNQLDKMNFKVKVDHQMTDWLDVGANTSANYMKNYQIPGSNAGTNILGRTVLQRPFDRPIKPDGSYYTGGTDELTYHNPVQILNEQDAYIENMRYLGSFYATLKFWEDKITFKNSLNTDILQLYDYTYYNENHPYGMGVGRLIDRHQTVKNILVENVLNYNDTFANETLDVNLMLGHSFQSVKTNNAMLDGSGFPSPSFNVIGVASSIDAYAGNAYTYAMESYFGRAMLSYKGRYVLTGTLRTDGSSKFAPDCRWGWFPSVSFGWNISKEPFMEGSGTDLKFRMSYGKTGNQEGIGVFAYQAQMGGGKNYNGNSGINSTAFGNEDLTWEKADQYDIGLDMGFLNDRITIIIDGYLKNTNDLLYSMPIHTTTGTSSIISNIGSMRNIGAELTFSTSVPLGPLHWSQSFNISFNRNRITSLPDAEKPISIGSNRALQVGKEMGAFYLFQHDGIYQYDAEVPDAQYEQGVRAGDIRWKDVDGNGLINDEDRVVMGSSNPDFFGGWNHSLSWKGLSLDVFFTYMYGNDTYMGQGINLTKLSINRGVLAHYAENRWTGPGTTNVYPRALNGDANNTKNSNFLLYDGSNFRLRSLTLAYQFPSDMLKKIHVKGLRVYAQADNVFLLTRYPGWDPEVSNNLDPRYFGVDNLNVPTPRTFMFGFNLTF